MILFRPERLAHPFHTPQRRPVEVGKFEIEPIVSGRTYGTISALIAGAILFGAAPFAREEITIKRSFFSLGIFALVAPGLWLLLQSSVGSARRARRTRRPSRTP